MASSIAHHAAGFSSISRRCRSIHRRRVSTLTTSARSDFSEAARKRPTVSSVSPVTYGLGHDSPKPIAASDPTACTHAVAVSDRSADARRNETVQGIRSSLSCKETISASRHDIRVQRQRQLTRVLQHGGLELSLALPVPDARRLVLGRCAAPEPRNRNGLETAAGALAVILEVQ